MRLANGFSDNFSLEDVDLGFYEARKGLANN